MFVYIHKHSGRLLLKEANTALGLPEYWSVGKIALPLIWNIARPVLITWGMSKIQSLLLYWLKKKT
jgi:ABC-type arginine transport system permease subunit